MEQRFDGCGLEAWARLYPSVGEAVAEMAGLKAGMELPARCVHVISDVHGEFEKLRHVINIGAGVVRPVVERVLSGLSAEEKRELLAVIYYPGEVIEETRRRMGVQGSAWVREMLEKMFVVVRELAKGWRRAEFNALLPAEYGELFKELMGEPLGLRRPEYFDAMLKAYSEHGGRDWGAVRAAARLIRNLTASEILVAGDLGDRGPRVDRVIEVLRQQPNVNVVWGNHDAHWMGACLGHEACIASVIRFSLRYGRLAQLEEGYGIVLDALEDLAREVYGDDPCEKFGVKATGGRDARLLARMQKAIAVMGLKLEGQLIERRAEWGLGERNLMKAIQVKGDKGTVAIGGKVYELTDARLPTVDWGAPNQLSEAEARCMGRLREGFIRSRVLWEQMKWVAQRGCMWTVREELLVFHACVPVDEGGRPLELEVDGKRVAGRELMDALAGVVRRAFRHGAEDLTADEGDWMWYLWCGPSSPLFGKDKIATFEGYFVDDEHAKKEKKNPYFEMIHDAAFVKGIGRLFGCGDGGEDVLVVNGHVPVKIEKGEKPVKRGGNAVTIDGAFSEAYGDHGYSLLLSSEGVSLAEYAHFESVEAVIREGKEIVPRVEWVRRFPGGRRVKETQEGRRVEEKVDGLARLVTGYEGGEVREGE